MTNKELTLKSRLFLILKLIELLQTERIKLNDILIRFNISERTAYRHFDIIRELNYKLKVDLKKRFYIDTKQDAKTNHSNNATESYVKRQSNTANESCCK